MDMAEQHNATSRVTRSVDDKIIAGVCGGLAEQFGINAWWFRWSFIILTFFGFAGVFLYVLSWILIPKETDDDSVAAGWMEGLDFTDVGTIFGVVLIGIAGVIVLNRIFNVSSALIAAGVLGLVGVLLYRGDLRSGNSQRYASADESDGSPEVEPVDSASSDSADSVSGAGTTVASSVATKPPRPKKVKKPRPPKSMLGRLTMAAVLITLSTMTLVALVGWFTFQPVDYLAAGMGIIAIGLLLGAWIGRARWLIVIGILLTPWLFFAALIPSISEWSVGDPNYRPQTVVEVQDEYSLTLGELAIDLTDLSEQDLASIGSIEASVGSGTLEVRVPLGVGVLVRAEVGLGTIQSTVRSTKVYTDPSPNDQELLDDCLSEGTGSHACDEIFGARVDDPWQGEYPWEAFRHDSGIGLDKTYSLGSDPIILELDLSVGAGQITIRQSGDTTVYEAGREG
ncbi:MAG: hypothetical protein BMS9Abin17_0886 [Acidimicrobiia bacterium]|nr:MAG: hypothetical protein BMS9Abin17_0886 [Acidimicrobiia bacterium]